MKPLQRIVRAGVGLLLLVGATTRAELFIDPLDAPSQMSELARSTPLLAATRAGNRLVVAGMRGHILYSDDNGKVWKQAQVPVSVTLTSLSFPSPAKGWAVGHSGVVLHTSDGGETWQRQIDGRQTPGEVLAFYEQLAAEGNESAAGLLEELPINWEHGAEQPWLGVWFDDEQHGFIVGPFNLIMETRDGGRSWVPWMHRVDNAGALHLNAIRPLDGVLYIPSEQGLVFRMRPGEERFKPLQTPYTGSFFGVCGRDEILLVYGLRGTVYASLDQGDSWVHVETGVRTAMTDCEADNHGKYLLSAASGQNVQIRLDAGSVTSARRETAPWPLTGLSMADGLPVGVGLGGIWVSEIKPQ